MTEIHANTASSLIASAAALRALAGLKKFKPYAASYLAAAHSYEAQAQALLVPDQGGQIGAHFAQ